LRNALRGAIFFAGTAGGHTTGMRMEDHGLPSGVTSKHLDQLPLGDRWRSITIRRHPGQENYFCGGDVARANKWPMG